MDEDNKNDATAMVYIGVASTEDATRFYDRLFFCCFTFFVGYIELFLCSFTMRFDEIVEKISAILFDFDS